MDMDLFTDCSWITLKGDYDVREGTQNHSKHSIYQLKEALKYQEIGSGSFLVHQEPIFEPRHTNAPHIVPMAYHSPLLHAHIEHRNNELGAYLSH